MVLAYQKLCETCFEVASQGYLATYEEYFLRLPYEWIETTVSHRLFTGKDMMMNTYIYAKEQGAMAAPTEKDLERLAKRGFTSEEIVSLLWLQKWYQTGGSDRIAVVRHWEFLKLLVRTGKLDV